MALQEKGRIAHNRTVERRPGLLRTTMPGLALQSKESQGTLHESGVNTMTRHFNFATALAVALSLSLFMASVVEGQALSNLTLVPGDEKEICTGVKAAVTPNQPKFGELRISDAKDPGSHIFYKAKDTSAVVIDTLECTVGEQRQTINIVISPKRSLVSGFSDEAYPEAFKALFLLFVLAIVLESALAILFNWRPFVEAFNSRAVKPVVSLAFAIALVHMFKIDLLTSLAKLINPNVPALDDTGRILTAMVIAGGSAAINNLMVGLGFRQARTPEMVTPTPPAGKGWISVSIIRSNKIKGPVTVAIGVANAGQVAVVASLEKSTTPTYRYFFRDRGRFPSSGGYAVAKGDNVTVKVSALKADGSGALEKTWGPNIIAEGAIIDLTFTMCE